MIITQGTVLVFFLRPSGNDPCWVHIFSSVLFIYLFIYLCVYLFIYLYSFSVALHPFESTNFVVIFIFGSMFVY